MGVIKDCAHQRGVRVSEVIMDELRTCSKVEIIHTERSVEMKKQTGSNVYAGDTGRDSFSGSCGRA